MLHSPSRPFYYSGALLLTVGFVTGLWVTATFTGAVQVPVPHLALAAHLNGLLGGFWLIAVGATLPVLTYSEIQQRRLWWLIAIAAWANWAITLVASYYGKDGLATTDDSVNNAIGMALRLFVVLPSFAGCLYWLRGFRKKN